MAHHSSGGDQASRAMGDRGGEQAPGDAELSKLLEELRAQAAELAPEGHFSGTLHSKDTHRGVETATDIEITVHEDGDVVVSTGATDGERDTRRSVTLHPNGTAIITFMDVRGAVTTDAEVEYAPGESATGAITVMNTDPQDPELKSERQDGVWTSIGAVKAGVAVTMFVQSQLGQVPDQGQATQTQ